MPRFKRIDLDRETSIGERLHDASTDLLPDNFKENGCVQWIVGYDSLQRVGDTSHRPDYFKQYGVAALASSFVGSYLDRRVPIYFAALFHIGRMHSVAEYGLERIRTLSAERNWRPSVTNLEKLIRSQPLLESTGEAAYAESVLSRMRGAGTARFQQQQRQAQEWWDIWLKEVGELQRVVDHFNEVWNGGEWRYALEDGVRASTELSALFSSAFEVFLACASRSNIVDAMVKAGVRFMGTNAPASDITNVSGLALLILAGLPEEYNEDRLGEHLDQFVGLASRWIDRERALRMQPTMEIALGVLKARYGNTNPFAQYFPCERIATPELRSLVREHTLPSGEASPWLAGWKKTLEDPFDGYTPLAPPADLNWRTLESTVRVVDSTLKAWINVAFRQSVAWEDFLQSLYEEHCVKMLGGGAGRANEEAGKCLVVWEVKMFWEYIDAVTLNANKLGYHLKCPSASRLEVLLKKTSQGVPTYENIEW